MPYRFEDPHAVPSEIRRIVSERIDDAIAQLRLKGEQQHEGIHEARKRFKEIRAVLRMVRAGLGEPTYRRENAWFRDAARGLSDVRDAQAVIESLDKLAAVTPLPAAAGEIRRELERRRDATAGEPAALAQQLKRLIEALQEARRAVGRWPLDGAGFAVLAPGLHRIYRQGCARMAEALAEPGGERYHEWRKRVKDQWYHSKLLRRLWPSELETRQASLKALSDLLGDDHDLVVLRQAVLELPTLMDESSLQAMLGAIGRRQSELRREATALGRRLHAETPKAHVRRLGQYWETWAGEVARQERLPALSVLPGAADE